MNTCRREGWKQGWAEGQRTVMQVRKALTHPTWPIRVVPHLAEMARFRFPHPYLPQSLDVCCPKKGMCLGAEAPCSRVSSAG